MNSGRVLGSRAPCLALEEKVERVGQAAAATIQNLALTWALVQVGATGPTYPLSPRLWPAAASLFVNIGMQACLELKQPCPVIPTF